MTTAPAVRNIPLNRLILSPTNVRKTPPSAAEQAELKASTKARGLKQNLVVHPAAGANGVHAVTAGGRRLKALQELAAEGVIPGDTEVPCLIEAPDEALETSLMENTIRAAMHPADEFVAMAGLIDAGATIEAIALRFGVSERHVRQRLRLGKLAPELLDAFRAGNIGLEAVTAFTLGADHAAQLAVWSQVKDRSYIQPYTVRHLLTETAIPLDSDLGLFVGAEYYEAADGRITRDLFSGDDEGFMIDAALVRRLSRSLKRRPRNYARNGRGPRRCSIPNTASWRNTRASARSQRRYLPNWPRRSNALNAASAISTTRKSPRTIGRPSLRLKSSSFTNARRNRRHHRRSRRLQRQRPRPLHRHHRR
jgi:ParB/RepB/Spo0J family partition protein